VEGSKCKVEGVTLANNVDAVLDQIEAQQAIELKPNPTPLEFLQAVYSNEGLPLSARLKAAIEAAQYVHPKLAASTHVDGKDFAALLETRLAQLSQPKPLAIESKPTSNATVESMVTDRRFRR
jgi:hypothetical protein